MFADRRAVVGGRNGAVGRWPDLVAVAPSALDLPPLDAASAIEDLLAGDAPVAAIFERDGALFAVTRGGCSVRLGVFVLQEGEGAHRLDTGIDLGNITIAVGDHRPDDDEDSDSDLLDLRAGIVRGSALSISAPTAVPAEAPPLGSQAAGLVSDEAPQPDPASPEPESAGEEASGPQPEPIAPAVGIQPVPGVVAKGAGAFDFVDLTSVSEPSKRTPLSLDTEVQASSATPTGSAGVTEIEPDAEDPSHVLGIVCSRDHFNNPRAAYCQVCGISMVHLTHHLIAGTRPTLGFLVFDDGATYALDRGYLIGRAPELGRDDTQCETLTLTDEQMSVSGNHARISLNGWDVEVTDLGSTNGSYTWDHSTQQWTRMAVGVATRVDSGATLAFGRRTLIFESVVRSK